MYDDELRVAQTHSAKVAGLLAYRYNQFLRQELWDQPSLPLFLPGSYSRRAIWDAYQISFSVSKVFVSNFSGSQKIFPLEV